MFSIITVNFNSEGRLKKTAASLWEQEAPWEYIIVDGNSTDESLQIGCDLEKRGQNAVRFYSEPDRGIYDAMNKGIRLARGRYILFMGAGDTLMPGVLNAVEKRLPKDNRTFVYGDFLLHGRREGGKFTKRRLCEKNICHQAIFYGRDIFDLCGLYDLVYPYYADWAMNLRCFGRRRIRKVYLPMTIAEIEPGGVSTSGDAVFQRDKGDLIHQHLGWPTLLRIHFFLSSFPFLHWPNLRASFHRKMNYWRKRLAGRNGGT
jgi:glycosyltransferase involved in cell wall biosynthesis